MSKLTDFDHEDEQQLERIVQSSRWGEVERARRRVVERFEAVDEAQFGTGATLSQDRVALLLQRAVQLYVRQVETILSPIDGDSTEWWDQREIGQFSLPDGRTVVITGLQNYLALDEQVTYTVREQHKPHAAHVGEVREVERSTVPPVGLHANAFSATNRGLADQGVDFETRSTDIGEKDVGGDSAVSPS